MAKIPFSKLKLSNKKDITTFSFEGLDIEVKKYLPTEEKLTLISNVLNSVIDDNNFRNSVKVDVYAALEIVYAYTNITFTDKQKEEPAKLYDLLDTSGFLDQLTATMDSSEYVYIINAIDEIVDNYYRYKTSALGIMETISTDYKDTGEKVDSISKKISNMENLDFLKEVVTKLG